MSVATRLAFEGLRERAIRATRVVGAATRFAFEGVVRLLSDRIARETFEDCASEEGGARYARGSSEACEQAEVRVLASGVGCGSSAVRRGVRRRGY